jgi:hypothetical protein
LEERAKTLAARGMDAFHECDAAGEMGAEAGAIIAVLHIGTGADAVGEDRLELVEFAAGGCCCAG